MSIHIASLPAGSLRCPRWESVLDCEASSDGSDGVLFVLTGAGGYVVKASSRPAEEYFASRVFSSIGLRVPQVRCVGHEDVEWKHIKSAIRAGAGARRDRGDIDGGRKVLLRLNSSMNRPQILVMELVTNSVSLEGYANAADLFNDSSPDSLLDLGRILAIDVFLNNSDRVVASCWDNEGNGANILVHTIADGSKVVVPIDSVVTAIKPSAPNSLFSRYRARACAFLNSVCEDTPVEVSLMGFSIFVQNNTGLVLSESLLQTVREGVRHGIACIASMDTGWLEALLDECNTAISVDWQEVWSSSVSRIDLDFLHCMATLFADVALEQSIAPSQLENKMSLETLPAPLADDITSAAKPATKNADSESEPQPSVSRALWCRLPEDFKLSLATRGAPFESNRAHISEMLTVAAQEASGPPHRPFIGAILAARRAPPQPSRPDISAMLAEESHPSRVPTGILGDLRSPSKLRSVKPANTKSGSSTAVSRVTSGDAHKTGAGEPSGAFLVAQERLCKANKNASHDTFVARYCRDESRLCLLRAEDSLLPLLHHVLKLSLRISEGGKVVVALDFDQTITDPKAEGGLRGGCDTALALKTLSELPFVELVIITATKPSQENALAIAAEVRHLGLGGLFEASWASGVALVRNTFTAPATDLKARELSEAVIALITISTDRSGRDLWRIDGNSAKIDVAGGTASFRMRTLPPDTTNEDALPWPELGPLSPPQLLKANTDNLSACPVRALRAYLEHTRGLRGRPGTEPLLLDVAADGETWEARPLPAERCAEFLTCVSTAAGLSGWEANALLEGEACVVRGGESFDIPLAVCGRLVCSYYNKWEGLNHFVKSRGLDPPEHLVFADDNPSNALSIFMGARAARWPCTSVWFEPPLHGKPETVDPAISELVENVTARFPLGCDFDDNTVVGDTLLLCSGFGITHPPSDFKEPLYYLSADQQKRCNDYPELAELTLPAWVPLQIIGSALSHSGHGITAAQQILGGEAFLWATEFENVHSFWHFEEPRVDMDGVQHKNSEACYHAQKLEFWSEAHWESVREDAMYRTIKAKTEAAPYVRSLLIATHPHPLLFIKNDSIWGFDPTRKEGFNLLAKQWMRLRAELMSLPSTCIPKLPTTPKQERSCVLLLQAPCPRDATAGAFVVGRALDETSAHISIVVLPEGFVNAVLHSAASRPGGQWVAGDPAPPELASYAAVALEHRVHIVCGTMMEPAFPPTHPPDMAKSASRDFAHFYTTCVVLGPNGSTVGSYRKRRIHHMEVQRAGSTPLVFDVGGGVGRVGVLICLDAEDPVLVKELRDELGCNVIVNPTHIPVPSRDQALRDKPFAERQWRVALQSMSRSFEWKCAPAASSTTTTTTTPPNGTAQGGFYLLRCDLPYPGGMGSSQAIGPCKTESVASMETEALVVDITAPSAGANFEDLLRVIPSSSYQRSSAEDNCGFRVGKVHIRLTEKLIGLTNTSGNDAAASAVESALVDRGDAPPLPPEKTLVSSLRAQGGEAQQTKATKLPSTAPSTAPVASSTNVAAMRFIYPSHCPKGKLLIVTLTPLSASTSADSSAASSLVVVVDVAKQSMDRGPFSSEVQRQNDLLLSDVQAGCASGSGGWLETGSPGNTKNKRSARVLLRVTPGGREGRLQILSNSAVTSAAQCSLAAEASSEVLSRASSLRVLKTIDTTTPVNAIALDYLGGGFATSSATACGPVVTMWCFSHNGVPAPLRAFLEI